jgi:pSer/pThr/pTyr-binding forkhead associated (FHA) protein
MEPTHDPAQGSPPAWGELVVLNGRLAGTRHPLGPPLAFVGRAASCEVRLNVEGVHPLHCVLAHGSAGLTVRDLEGPGGTLVNGERVASRLLQDGDLLTVGPFQLRVALPPGTARPEAQPSEAEDGQRAEKDALRVQAAAVVAQQAALAEEEARLEQRRATLEQQEGQLAAHLEEKRRRLLQVAEHAQAARAGLQKERAEHEKHIEKVTSDLGEAERELLDAQRKAQAERLRLADLRRRLKQRWHRHWMAERTAFRQREEGLAAARRQLEKDTERLQQQKAAQVQARLRFNGEAELGKRQLQADREALQQERLRWQGQRDREAAELSQRERALGRREAALADGERLLEDERYRLEKGLGQLKRESEGLENRIRNQRRKVADQHQEVARLEAQLTDLRAAVERALASAPPAPPETAPAATPGEPAQPVAPSGEAAQGATAAPAADPPAPPVEQPAPEPKRELEAALAEKEEQLRQAEAALRRRVGALERLVEELADQRLLLVEQWGRLAAGHGAWQGERTAAVAELEALAAGVPAREEALAERERCAQAAEDDLRRRHQEAVHLRHHLEGWTARLRIRESGWESERDRALTDLRGREQLAERHLTGLLELRQRWAKRRRQELDLVRAERAACERLRQECATLRDDLWRRGNALEEERRLLAEKTLALEQYRQQYVVKAADAAAAEKRVERLRRRWVSQNLNLIRATVTEREALQREVAQLDARHTALHKQMESLTVREASLAQRQTAWEEAQVVTEVERSKLQQEVQSMQAQRDRHALHLMELQEEVERIARILLEEPELPLAGEARAA